MHHNLHLDNLLAYVNYIAATDMISSYLFSIFMTVKPQPQLFGIIWMGKKKTRWNLCHCL